MIYREFKGKKISAMAMGCMRLPVIDGQDAVPNEAEVSQMVQYAMENGVNYYDTAWGYHEGNSELVMGRVLKKYPRESFYLADKFPGYDISNIGKTDEIFEEQLKKLQVDYFDFYLVHNVCELNIDKYLESTTVEDLLKRKAAGQIKHLGFSCHSNNEDMIRFLDAYGEYMEFAQIQLNWLDYGFQDAQGKIAILKERNIPIWVMEPVRGGGLAKIEDEFEEILRGFRPEASTISWAYRFLQTIPEAVVTLSGSSSLEQIKENIDYFAEDLPLNEEEWKALQLIAKEKTGRTSVPCTACRYCTTHCPMELNIPHLIALYNEHVYTGGGFLAPMAIGALPEEKRPAACIACHSCEQVCPQVIKISEVLEDFDRKLKEDMMP